MYVSAIAVSNDHEVLLKTRNTPLRLIINLEINLNLYINNKTINIVIRGIILVE